VKKIEKRRIKFQPAVRVVLIPSRDEYTNAGLGEQLWWDESDYTAFKKSAVGELKVLMQKQGIVDSKVAIQVMYQPGLLEDDESNSGECAVTRTRSESSEGASSPLTVEKIFESSVVKPSVEVSAVSFQPLVPSVPEVIPERMGLLAARTDVDLTDHQSFERNAPNAASNIPLNKYKNKQSSPKNMIQNEQMKVHPLAYMCA
jgi:hypothetical protein